MKQKENKQKRKRIFPKVVIFVALILALVQLTISHRLASSGGRLNELENQASQVQKEIRLLEEEVNQMGSLSVVSQKAELLGMEKTQKIIYLRPQLPVALGKSELSSKTP